MLFIQYNSQLCSERLISNVEHLIINPPLQSVFNLAFCYQLSQQHDCTAAHIIHVGGDEGCGGDNKDRFRHPWVDGFTVRGNALAATSQIEVWLFC